MMAVMERESSLDMLARIARVEAQGGRDCTVGQLAARIAQEMPAARLRTTVAELLIATGWLNRAVLTAVDADLALAVNEALRPALDN